MDLSVLKTKMLIKPELAFYTSVMLQLDVHLSDEVDTAATNGKSIKFNETFMDSLSEPEQLFVMVHELLHCSYLHMFRGELLDKRKYNVAADYHINYFLVNTLGLTMPKQGLYDKQYAGLSTEEIYDLLPDDDTEPDYDDLEDGEGDPDESRETIEKEVQGIIQQASVEAQIQGQAGNIPADILRRIDEEINPLLPWQTLLARYAQERSNDDYSWQRRNLYLPNHYLPSLYSETVGSIATYVDCSGSVSEEELAQYCAEIRQIMSELNPVQTTIVSFSHHITNIQVIEGDEDTAIEVRGNGGTCCREVVNKIKASDDVISIIFTDGEMDLTPAQELQGKEILWIIVNNPNFKCDIGSVIHAVI